jgi:tetratricopeptide (TPR) repeat protein
LADVLRDPLEMTERRDPTLGQTPVVEDGEGHPPPPPRRGDMRRRRWFPSRRWLIGIAVALALGVFALVHWRGAIGARLVPPPQQNSLMRQADAALRAGRLTSSDGRGARELYLAALARDPDDLAAREGLVRVGAAALAQAQAAMQANRIDEARRDLDLARDLAVPVADLQPVEQALRRSTGGESKVGAWIAKADAAERAGHLDDGDASALAFYQQALAAAPDNAVALAKRRALLGRLLGGVGDLLAHDDVDGARKLVDRVAAVDPGHLDLPATRARLAEAEAQRARTNDRLLDGADADLRAGRIDAAVATWRRVLAQDPANLRSHTGLRAAGEALVRDANRAASDFDFAGAQAALAKARSLSPELPSLRAAELHMQQARAMRSGMGPIGTRGAIDKTRIDDLLAAADHAIARDELVDPPGDSAFDKLHAASALAPGDPRVLAANRRFVATVVACAQREMTDNRLARASACLDALITIQPTYASLPSLRTSLAKHWLAYADERIGAGEIDTAEHAIASAKRLTPDDPAIAAMQARAQQARGGAKH